jgi:hypothetical protein
LYRRVYRGKTIYKTGLIVIMIILMLFMPLRYPAEQQSGPVVRLLAPDGYDMELMVENVTNLYAASVDLYYDPDKVNIERIETGDLFTGSKSPWMELVNNINADEGIASFAVSLMGDVQTIGGTGTLVKIYYRLVDKRKPKIRILDYRTADSSGSHEFSVVPTLVSGDIEFIPYRSRVQINN